MSTPEGRVKTALNRQLDKLPLTYRFMPVQNGMGSPALDYYLCVAGRFIAIETKIPGKNLTPRQENTKAEMEAAGGLVFVVRDRGDIEFVIEQLRDLIGREKSRVD